VRRGGESARDGWRASDFGECAFSSWVFHETGWDAPVKSNRLITPHLPRAAPRGRIRANANARATPRTWTLEAGERRRIAPALGRTALDAISDLALARQTPLASAPTLE